MYKIYLFACTLNTLFFLFFAGRNSNKNFRWDVCFLKKYFSLFVKSFLESTKIDHRIKEVSR